MNSRSKPGLGGGYALFAILILWTGLVELVVWAAPTTSDPPGWLEPRGLSIVELVGQVPDEYLQGSIISYADWDGIVVYESGSRVGNTVVVRTTIYPRYVQASWVPNGHLSLFGCLGQRPRYDHMGSVVPASTLRVYDDQGRERTQEIVILRTTVMDTLQPMAGSDQLVRYPQVEYGLNRPNPLPLDGNGLHIPTNSGCSIELPGGDYRTLTGVFTLTLEPSVYASVRGSQTATFQSYIGIGSVGIFEPLMAQLRQTYGDRHSRIPLAIPAGANYFLLRFPPMPGDPYTDCCQPPYLNADRLSAGTYRLADGGMSLSTDMVFSAGFPLARAWQDADQAPSSTFLPVLTTLPELTPPEYILPANIPYDDCFTAGNCPSSVLEQIHSAQMNLDIIYLQVTRPTQGQWLPLRLAGPNWSSRVLAALPAASEHTETISNEPSGTSEVLTYSHYVFLPLLMSVPPEEPPSNCPCGWFDDLGRMLGFEPGS